MTPVELVCFHHAGGGAASFHPLRLALADMDAEVAFTALRDGVEVATFWGSFHEVRSPDRIVQTQSMEGTGDGAALNTLTFEELPDGRTRLTDLTVVDTFEFRDMIMASGMESGVIAGYKKLDELLAKG